MLFVNRGTCVNDLPRVAALRDSGTVGSRMRVQHVVHSLHTFFRTDSTDSPDCLPILLSISVFTL